MCLTTRTFVSLIMPAWDITRVDQGILRRGRKWIVIDRLFRSSCLQCANDNRQSSERWKFYITLSLQSNLEIGFAKSNLLSIYFPFCLKLCPATLLMLAKSETNIGKKLENYFQFFLNIHLDWNIAFLLNLKIFRIHLGIDSISWKNTKEGIVPSLQSFNFPN